VNGGSAAPVRIDYYDQNGLVRSITEALVAGEARLHYQPNDGLPPGFHGSAVVRAAPGVSGVANVLARNGGAGDWLLAYEGIGAP
jgi:hypothetical protein